MKLGELLNLIPKSMETCVVCGSNMLTGTQESMNILLADLWRRSKVTAIEARDNVVWIEFDAIE